MLETSTFKAAVNKLLNVIGRIGILGAGTMGAGIAQVVAEAGIEAILHDPIPGAYERAHERVAGYLQRKVEKGTLDEAAAMLLCPDTQGPAGRHRRWRCGRVSVTFWRMETALPELFDTSASQHLFQAVAILPEIKTGARWAGVWESLDSRRHEDHGASGLSCCSGSLRA